MNRQLVLLADYLTHRPQDFDGPQATDAVAWLIAHVQQVARMNRLHKQHCVMWFSLSEEARSTAISRQMAALAGRLALRGGMGPTAAVAWVIELAGMSRVDFKSSCIEALNPDDRFSVWQWCELRKLGLKDDFMSRRQVERWMEADAAWLFDERWAYPLHLVDSEVFDALGVTLPEPMTQGVDDGR
jgi:hypothetical protein